MPFTVTDLIAEKSPAITSKSSDSVQQALKRMVEHNYSQLPVINEDKKVLGMITYETIVQATSNFNVPLTQLRVVDAMDNRVSKFRSDADLFEILDKVQEKNAALVIDRDRKLLGIVTSHDTTQYFRQRAEDIMLVQDIETTLKDYILLGFHNISSPTDEDDLNQIIEEMTDSGNVLYKDFHRAINHYLSKAKQEKPEEILVKEVFAKHLQGNKRPPKFGDLTLYQYIELFLYRKRWQKYQLVFPLERENISSLLHSVRETRNDLAHFRDDITDEKRRQLRFCADWLSRYQADLMSVLMPEETKELLEEVSTPIKPLDLETEVIALNEDLVEDVIPLEDEISSADSRYAPLAIWLQEIPSSIDSTSLSFVQISEIIGEDLPKSAYRHRAWWANDTVSHVQSREWLSVGWRAASVNITQERVKFSRIKDRERAYINFYSTLLSKLEKIPAFKDIEISPRGTNWLQVARLPYNENSIASLNFSFARNNQFRVELYIDTGNQKDNKLIYDVLATRYKDEIESAMGRALGWERLNSRRASRIALYWKDISINAIQEMLDNLCDEAVNAMAQFEKVIQNPLNDAIENDSTYGLRTPERDYRIPILKSLNDLGGQERLSKVVDSVGVYMEDSLNDYDRTPLDSTDELRWRNTVKWERSNMVKEGLLKNDSPRGTWEISEAGKKYLETCTSSSDSSVTVK